MDRRVVGWSVGRPMWGGGGQISPWPARKVTDLSFGEAPCTSAFANPEHHPESKN